jgi:hypothetical protein
VFQVGNDLRDRGLRHPELRSRLRHAAQLHGREERVEIPQPEASADLSFPVDLF